jgi:hypothetical protein
MPRFTVQTLAEHANVSCVTVISWIQSGCLRAFNANRHPHAKRPTWRISLEDYEEFERSRMTTPTPKKKKKKKRREVVTFYP